MWGMPCLSIVMTFLIKANSLKTTLALGSAIGVALKGGETIELRSDIGGGKTTLTKGIAAGMGSQDTVQSPTFTVSRIYQAAKNRELHHFDFYRLHDPGIMAAELAESLGDPQVIVVIEWSDIVADILPETRIVITITSPAEHERHFAIDIPEGLTSLNTALQQFTKEQELV